MPEGVEVKIIGDGLRKLLLKRRLLKVTIIGGRYSKRKPTGYRRINSAINKGQQLVVTAVGTKGKFIWIKLSPNWYIFSTLGMTGAWTVNKSEYNKVRFDFAGATVYLFDIRNFATLKFIQGDNLLDKKLSKLGIDIFSNFSTKDLITSLQKVKNKNLADALLSQRYISGLGTYLISEVLYVAKISPSRVIKSLSLVEYNHLYSAIKNVSNESLRAQKFTIKNLRTDIKDVNGYKFKIYDKETDSRGNNVSVFKVKSRSIRWVPAVQK